MQRFKHIKTVRQEVKGLLGSLKFYPKATKAHKPVYKFISLQIAVWDLVCVFLFPTAPIVRLFQSPTSLMGRYSFQFFNLNLFMVTFYAFVFVLTLSFILSSSSPSLLIDVWRVITSSLRLCFARLNKPSSFGLLLYDRFCNSSAQLTHSYLHQFLFVFIFFDTGKLYLYE